MRDFTFQKRLMAAQVLSDLNIADEKIKNAFLNVERHEFVAQALRFRAYEDISLPIGFNQTISHPSIVAYMTSLLELEGNERVLEIGTGSGYQAAILSKLCKQVYTVEIKPGLFEKAHSLLKFKLKITNIKCYLSDGSIGLPDIAPFDRIIVTCSSDDGIPEKLISQLKFDGIMVLPVKERDIQKLIVVKKRQHNRLSYKIAGEVDFVPLVKGQDNKDVFTSMA